MKGFIKENWLWLVSIIFFTTLFLLILFGIRSFEPWLIELFKTPFKIIGVITIFYGAGKAFEKLEEFVDHTWQAGFLIFLIICSLCFICNFEF